MTPHAAILLWFLQAPENFAQLSAKATEARAGNRQQEAVALYQRALRLNPKWDEGWYFLGSLFYDQDRATDCAAAFTRFTELKPSVSAGHAFLGLCRFQLKQYGPALESLEQARKAGLPHGEQLTDVASYHAAILHTKLENFERALQILHFFSARAQIDPKLIEAAGIAALRRAILPQELAFEDRELIYRVGRAVMNAGDRRASEANEQFQEILEDHPAVPNLHYAYASFLIGGDADRAIAELRSELDVQPGHLPSLVLLGLEYLKRGDPGSAKALGEQAVRAAPRNFTSHVVLGRALIGLEDLRGGIRELELAVALEPTSPQTRIALASAYQKAGNTSAAAQQRAEFQRLKKEFEAEQEVR